jgi:FAD/FMN-containing dehydrogenase
MHSLTGRVVLPGDPGWDEARKAYDQRFDVQPRAVVFCQDAADVAGAVRWCRDNRVPFRARGGRHSYEGYSLVAGGVIIDVSDMDNVRVDRQAGTAEVGAGIYMLKCSEWLGDVGVTFPLATGPTVGLAGLTLGGGFGLTSRRFGLTCDNLLAVDLILADGSAVRASEREHPDLFWACRGGGGGNFGVATRFQFRVHPVSLVAAFMVEWTWDRFADVVASWQAWAVAVDDGLSAALQLTVDRRIRLYGMYTPDRPEDAGRAADLLKALTDKVAPAAPPTLQVVPFVLGARLFFGEGAEKVDPGLPSWAVHVHSDQQIYKSTSAAAMAPFGAAAIQTLQQYLESVPPLSQPPVQPSMVQLLPGGGAPSRVAPDATAVYLRQAQFIVQYDAFWAAPADGDATMGWVESFRGAMLPHTTGAYVNYADSRLDDPLRAYYGPNLERLVRVKRRYDPDNVFSFPQSIPV